MLSGKIRSITVALRQYMLLPLQIITGSYSSTGCNRIHPQQDYMQRIVNKQMHILLTAKKQLLLTARQDKYQKVNA